MDEKRCESNESVLKDHEKRLRELREDIVKMQINMEQLPKINKKLESIEHHVQKLNTTDILMEDRTLQRDIARDKSQAKANYIIYCVIGFWTLVQLIDFFWK